MASTTMIETVTITRPLKVIALICGLLVVILMVLGLASADWLMAAGWRQGLFMHCIDPEAPTPLPFDITAQPGCYAARPATYIKAAAGLCVATLAADVCGALLTGLGLRAADHRTKFRYYRFAVLAMATALMCILIALVIYPVCFAAELNLGNRSVWEFGWAYGVGWGAAIFLFGAVVLLLCDKESEELYYKERKLFVVGGGGGVRGAPLGPRAPARPGAVSATPSPPSSPYTAHPTRPTRRAPGPPGSDRLADIHREEPNDRLV